MTKLGFVRAASAAVALTAAQAAVAAGEAGAQSFAITPSGWLSLLGFGIFSVALVWVMRKMG